MFTVRFHCLWVLKGRTDVSERVYSLGRGPWEHKRVGFEVSQAARSPRFQTDDGVLRPRGGALRLEILKVANCVHCAFPLPYLFDYFCSVASDLT